MTEKELIRSALMGSQEAQRACTDKGIVLPCPCCKSDAELIAETANFIGEPERDYCVVRCKSCFLKTGLYKTQHDVLHKWNTRPALAVGKCKDCKSYTALGHCKVHSQEPDQCSTGAYVEMLPDDFCSYFEPKED